MRQTMAGLFVHGPLYTYTECRRCPAIRKQIFLGADQNEPLKRLARRTGRSEAAIIREAIETRLAAERQADAAWEALLDRWRQASHGQETRSWSRDAIYEERLGKYGRADDDTH